MKNTSLFAGLAALFSLAPHVSAHGYVSKLVVGGKTYTGASPYQAAVDSPIRQINDVGPVKDLTSPNMICGQSAKLATQVANATAGDSVELYWVNGDGGNWVHVVGPLMGYIAACANNDCTTDDATSAAWIKISELGQKTPGGSSWYMADLAAGKPHTVALPASLPTGSYLLRTEIIALQGAVSVGGAEFYPSCAQLRVTGSSGAAATSLAKTLPSADVAPFPGAYSPTDKGLVVPDVYNPGFDYTNLFPGPVIPTSFAAPSDASGTTGSTSSNATATASAAQQSVTAVGDGGASVIPIPSAAATSSGLRTVTVPRSTAKATATYTLPNAYGTPPPSVSPTVAPSSAVPTSTITRTVFDPNFPTPPKANSTGSGAATSTAIASTTSLFAGRVVVVTYTLTFTVPPASNPTATSVAAKTTGVPAEFVAMKGKAHAKRGASVQRR